jgi:hypothetical protein
MGLYGFTDRVSVPWKDLAFPTAGETCLTNENCVQQWLGSEAAPGAASRGDVVGFLRPHFDVLLPDSAEILLVFPAAAKHSRFVDFRSANQSRVLPVVDCQRIIVILAKTCQL